MLWRVPETVFAFLAFALLPLLQAAPMIASSDLRGFDELPEGRRKHIEAALKSGGAVEGMPYNYGGNGAVFAAAGLERNPARPQRKRNTPYPISHLEFVMALPTAGRQPAQPIYDKKIANTFT